MSKAGNFRHRFINLTGKKLDADNIDKKLNELGPSNVSEIVWYTN